MSELRQPEVNPSPIDGEVGGIKTSYAKGSHKLYVRFGLTYVELWALGIAVSIGGQFVSWSEGLIVGVGSYGIACLLVLGGYTTLTCNISEVISGLPFAGGSYGLARCSISNYWGYMLGCIEVIQYIFLVAATLTTLEKLLEMVLPDVQHYPPVTWLILYIIPVLARTYAGIYFWWFVKFVACSSILILLLFVFGSMKYVDFSQYAAWPSTADNSVSNPWFIGGVNEFMQVYPLATWLFVGVESLKETSYDVDEPKSVIPKAQTLSIVTLVVTSILVFFVCISLPPGVKSMSSNIAPFNAGFQLMFDLTDQETRQYATILSLPAVYGLAFAFSMMYAKLLYAMSESHLKPHFLNYTYTRTGAPYMALILGSLLSYCACLIGYAYPDFQNSLFNIAMLAAFTSYVTQSVIYILVKTRYSVIKCDFQSPFGIYGAMFSIFVWLIGIISIIGFQKNNIAIIAISIVFASFTITYFTYYRKRQTFSEMEKEIFFRIYVINRKLFTHFSLYFWNL